MPGKRRKSRRNSGSYAKKQRGKYLGAITVLKQADKRGFGAWLRRFN